VHRYAVAKSLFVRALDLPAAERPAFVAREAGDDLELRRDVEELLAYHDESASAVDALPPHDAAPERVGPWRIEGELGRGGIGVVYLASRGGEPAVALKLLRGGLLSPTLVARFRREAAVLARLDHPGIARLIDTGIDDGPHGPRPWLAMERVEGVDLRSWAAGERGQAERLELMARVCDAVEHAHAHGVVHRDLKPENILVRPDGRPVVLDFGVARLVDSDVRATTLHTTVGVLVGTIRYMSPEQADARPDGIGPRSDVHQLAVLTYELVTGRLPYEVPEHSVHRALVAVLTAPPRPMDELPPRLRRPLERVLRAALAKDPARRLASAALLATDLRRVAAGRSPLARPPREARSRWPAAGKTAALIGAGALALLWATGRIGPAPSPLDRVEGKLAPARMYRRIMLEADSAVVRLHFTTRTLPRLREASAHVGRALALLGTVEGRPWHDQLRAYLRFRRGEAEYLVAERTYDATLYAQAADTWYSARELPQPPARVPLPDTFGIAAARALAPMGTEPWAAAAMALEDRARVCEPVVSLERALAIRREGAAVFLAPLGARSLLDAPAPANPEVRRVLAGWRQGMGASLSRLGFELGDSAMVDEGIRHLERAAAMIEPWHDGSATASIVHDLGTACLQRAALVGDGASLDTALVRLGQARDLRGELPGYTSFVHSSLALARARRLVAWRSSDPVEQRVHLAFALELLETPPSDEVSLGAPDRSLLALGRAEVLVDLACVEQDESLLAQAAKALEEVEEVFPRGRAPVLAAAADVQRIRIAGQLHAVTHSHAEMGRARQVADRYYVTPAGRSPRTDALVGAARGMLGSGAPNRFDLRYPIPYPY